MTYKQWHSFLAAVFCIAVTMPLASQSVHALSEGSRSVVRHYGRISVSQTSDEVVIDTGPIQITFSKVSGLASYAWDKATRVRGVYSSARVGSLLKSTDYTRHTFLISDIRPLLDGFGRGIKLSFTSTTEGKPAFHQIYYLYEGKRYFLLKTRLEDRAEISTNWLAAIQLDMPKGIDIGASADPRVLIVPWDNDHFIRYRSEPINSANTSYEVTSIYDNASRHGLVVGSLTHDIWKTGIDYRGSDGAIDALTVYGGASSSITQDTMPHGSLSGTEVASPRIFVGYYEDWRTGMEEFGSANSVISPPLPWAGRMPVGWNSWYAYTCNVNTESMTLASDFIRAHLQDHGFGNAGIVYVNWDSVCGGGPPPDFEKVAQYVKRNGQRPGIYFVPFARFGNEQGDDQPVPGTKGQYTWNDLLLRDSGNAPRAADRGRALDPTHPGTRTYVESMLHQFTQWGYEYVKLDFLSHGAMEGKHFLRSMTAMQAYNYGMKYIRDAIARKMFVSLSIAPLFPGAEYANSRRISCDAAGSLKDTEYMLNSVTYGWWLDKYYRYNDGDLVVIGPNTLNEARSRVTASAITGMFLDSDRLAENSTAQQRAQDLLTRPEILAVARLGKTFRPVENDTGDRAADAFVLRNKSVFYFAVFNYQQESVVKSVDLARAGLNPHIPYRARDLWTGASSTVLGKLSVHLEGAQAALFTLTREEAGAARRKNESP